MTVLREFFNAPPTDLVIPKTLVDRDPRNPQHVDFALALLCKLGEMHITERTKRELTKLRIAPPKNAKVVKGAGGEHDIVIGASFLLETGLQFSNNQIATCHACKAALQFRPETASSRATKLCYFCAADRLLAEYWKSH